jgi:type I restriction enzyme, S subunit
MIARLGDIADFINGGAWSDREYTENGIPVVKVTNLKNGTVDLNEVNYIPESSLDKYSRHLLQKGDLVIATVGSHPNLVASAAGRATIIPAVAEGALLNQNALCIRSNSENFHQGYLGYLGKSDLFQGYVKSVGRGAANQVRISLGLIKEFSFHLPPLPTQRCIASILSAYDDLIENNLKRIKLLEEKLMIKYSILEDESKNSNENDFSEYVTFIKGIEPGSESYLSEKSDGTLPFIRVGDLSKRDSDIYIEESKSKGLICNPDDVLISMDGTIGMVKYGIFGCYSSGIRKAVSKGLLNNALIFCYLSSKKIQGVIYSHSKGSTIQHAGSSINHFQIKLPKESSLVDFIRFSNPIYDLMNNLLKQNVKLREARDILLPRLINGLIEV